ncbi:DNA gyrase [Adlercreutzia equolifaciens]|uniref:DNA gyrase n=1 Tax=Adlercreutzia TaxID=447020 RepID=UPI001D06EEEE|nr:MULTISPECIES: DNA gyrase [Adlercreutzia]MCB6761572.1 DNA gyrase [Adlercreutzia equolifaciens]MCB6977303.1 DNA gyrase [Adlercreutzia equolifaciens]MCQ5069697.1 DNA gyrase [Adlercreutzia sp. DFI.6.23]MDE8685255.1 DNA gyrase [Adlercreutzia rubneri]
MPEKKNTYLTLHKNFVRTDIEYTDRETGEVRTFNSVTLPKGTVVDGVDVSYYQFSPMFVNESRYRGENYRDIPLLTDSEVWLKKSVLDEDGQPVLDERGKPAKNIVRVMPAQIKEALDRNRSEYLQSLSEKARGAREGSERLGNGAERAAQSRESIAM